MVKNKSVPLFVSGKRGHYGCLCKWRENGQTRIVSENRGLSPVVRTMQYRNPQKLRMTHTVIEYQAALVFRAEIIQELPSMSTLVLSAKIVVCPHMI